MKTLSITAVAALLLLSISCSAQNSSKADQNKLNFIFPKGELGPAKNFTGKAWNISLVENDSVYNTIVGNVFFEPGARSNWHIHPSGQILIITDGTGYHQIKGQPRQTLKKGDIVKCPPNVEHWHGASPEAGMLQQYILPKTEKGIVTWLQKVTDEEYLGSK
ncbi:cupin domain-containing protein [Pedobacter hiemivivus]|uniref:Cupin domain-containing protein n=1 Tax=Pedobacter hiemivivus TaxID=2530454 RepID=A0A4R0N7Q7_9SPHI|nr:cupin domain-containing protein [Pedobacter hiemivivus]TCC96015.1 cupin domain-containing protein [Pedobacter hiemivivus]TKC65526.1 cupin domain-containing protein [Pedobacter hiemivivus]